MRAVGRFIVRVAELVEAEGRAAKRGSFQLATAIALLSMATAIVLAGVGFLAAAVFLLLNVVLPGWAAAGIMGVVLMVTAFAVLMLAAHYRDKKASQ